MAGQIPDSEPTAIGIPPSTHCFETEYPFPILSQASDGLPAAPVISKTKSVY